MARDDFYSVLGLSRDATKDDIRRAHRKLARELHPDMNKAPDAAARFAKVQEAYDTLSDEDKRKTYDRVGHDAYVAGMSGGAGQGGPGSARGWPGGTYTWTNAGGAPHSDPFNAEDIGSIFEEVFGARPSGYGRSRHSPGGARRATRTPAKGRDIEHEITIPFDLMLRGGAWTLQLTRGSDVETIEVTIPQGVADGAKLRLRGKGERVGSAPPGDLLLQIRVAPHPSYERHGMDLHAPLPLSIVEATLGAKVDVRTPSGVVGLTIPPGTPSGAKLRVKGKGVSDAKGAAGDFYAIVKIVPPKELDERDATLLREIGERIGHPAREE
ncbi:MAG: DnaJ domain-containing protein [Phycisphaeraceae bacterium]|nr:DnaJ domain-containing protein [Phycisphaeraceae bacterium]